mgnify:FL=1
MQYKFDLCYTADPQPFSRKSGKEMLQYAVGGLLYMPASNTKIAEKIISGEYYYVKSMVLDLEDALGDDLVQYGIKTIAQTIQTLAKAVESGKLSDDDIPLIFIRIRSAGQMTSVAKVLGSTVRYITGFNIPKFDCLNCDRYVEEFIKLPQHLYVMPIIENKQALYQQLRMPNLLAVYDCLNELSGQVLNIRVGGADFCSVLGVRRGISDTIYDIGAVRSALEDIINVFGRSYVVSGPVWEYFRDKNSPDDVAWQIGLQTELKKDKLNGFIGKTCIHPSQLPIVQQSLIVNHSDYREAISILGMNENTVGVAKSVSGNRMNEVKTHTNWARKIVGLASVYGTVADEHRSV